MAKIVNPKSEAMKAAMMARVPVMLVGAPGIGKTAHIRQLAEDMGYKLITLIGSQMDPTDVTGLPKGEVVAEREDGTKIYGTTYLAPIWQVRCMTEKKIILFFDEFSNTPGATRAALLTFFQNREFSDGTPLPDEVIVIGAMNPPDDAADGYDLDKPTTNRMMFIDWDSLVDEWYEGMVNGWGNEKISPEELSWRKKIVGFLKEYPHRLQDDRKDENVGTSEVYGVNHNDSSALEVMRAAWASRRSWHNVARILAFAPNSVVVQDQIVSGTVGAAASADFRTWLRKNSSVDLDAIMADPYSIDWNTMEIDDCNMVLRSLSEKGIESVENYLKVIDVYEAIADAGRIDIGSTHLFDFMQSRPKVKNATKAELNEIGNTLQKKIFPKYRSSLKRTQR